MHLFRSNLQVSPSRNAAVGRPRIAAEQGERDIAGAADPKSTAHELKLTRIARRYRCRVHRRPQCRLIVAVSIDCTAHFAFAPSLSCSPLAVLRTGATYTSKISTCPRSAAAF